jgi:hypothetical protein
MTRKAFEDYDEPVKINMDPEEALALLLNTERCEDHSEPDENQSS